MKTFLQIINNIHHMKKFCLFLALAGIAVGAFSCAKEYSPMSDTAKADLVEVMPLTKSVANDTIVVVVYVETNDVNPLNAGDYCMDGAPFVDIVELFAANIHKETVNGVVRPTLYLNDKLTPVLEDGGYLDYVVPLQEKGMKVLLTVLGDWAGLGVANMNATQRQQFAEILAYAVDAYGLDGIGFDDEYANYSGSLISGSFGDIIVRLRALLGDDKLITVFQYGNYGSSQISATAGAQIDYAYPNFNSWYSSSSISGVTTPHWAPYSLNLGYNYGSYYSSYFQNIASSAVSGGYGALMFFNLRRRSDVDPLPVFQYYAAGAYGSTVSMCTNVESGVTAGDRPRDAGSVDGGFTITYDDI